MVVPTEHALNEAIQVAPLVLSDDVKRHKVSRYNAFAFYAPRCYLEDFLSVLNFYLLDLHESEETRSSVVIERVRTLDKDVIERNKTKL